MERVDEHQRECCRNKFFFFFVFRTFNSVQRRCNKNLRDFTSFNLLSPSMIVFDIIMLYRNKSSN